MGLRSQTRPRNGDRQGEPHIMGKVLPSERLLKQFEEKTGCPVIINTSFNIRGEPIVCTPEDAYRCFMATDMDALVVENCLLIKEEQPDAEDHSREAYLGQFSLD